MIIIWHIYLFIQNHVCCVWQIRKISIAAHNQLFVYSLPLPHPVFLSSGRPVLGLLTHSIVFSNLQMSNLNHNKIRNFYNSLSGSAAAAYICLNTRCICAIFLFFCISHAIFMHSMVFAIKQPFATEMRKTIETIHWISLLWFRFVSEWACFHYRRSHGARTR